MIIEPKTKMIFLFDKLFMKVLIAFNDFDP